MRAGDPENWIGKGNPVNNAFSNGTAEHKNRNNKH